MAGWTVRGAPVFICGAMCLMVVPRAHASRPTSGDPSVLSGRTPGGGETLLAAGVGWPSIWTQLCLAPRSTVNVGIRAAVLFGSPILGIDTGVGLETSVPMRIHLFGSGTLDLALSLRPLLVVAEGRAVGERDLYEGDVGVGGGLEVGLLGGLQAGRTTTLVFGAGAGLTYVDVPKAPDGNHPVGTFLIELGLEVLVTEDTLLFAHVVTGGGVARSRAFDGRSVVRVSLGLAYLL